MNNTETTIRLLVVDDHKLFRRGLVALLAQDPRFRVVGEAEDAGQAIASVRHLKPDLVLLDNHMPGVQGVHAIGDLKAAHPLVRILMLTVSENADDLAAGLRAGADGYLLKTVDTQDLCDSIVRVWEGDSVISPEMMGKLVRLLRHAEAPLPSAQPSLQSLPETASAHDVVARPVLTVDPDDPIHSLSPREKDILRLIAKGDSNKHIARALDIAETTVKIHVQHILRKLNMTNRVHAAVYATERGFA
jgi:two-component system, NarL family, nitrate/nitrite response regulator NarL